MKTKILICSLALSLLGLVSLTATSTISSWVKDMYNQPSIKPQEAGGLNTFPQHTVAQSGIEYAPAAAPFDETPLDFSHYEPPENRLEAFTFDQQEGHRNFLTFCAVCHGADGQLNQGEGTQISEKGLQVKAITKRPMGFYYDRLMRGGMQMPDMGFKLSEAERWNIAHYIGKCLHSSACD